MKISSARHLNRHARLLELIEEAGGPSGLAALSGTPKSHISAMKAGDRGVGDTLAAKLEQKTGKPAGWMDQPAATLALSDLSPLEAQIVAFLRVIAARSPKRPIEIHTALNHEAAQTGDMPQGAANPFAGAAPPPSPPQQQRERKAAPFILGVSPVAAPGAKKAGKS